MTRAWPVQRIGPGLILVIGDFFDAGPEIDTSGQIGLECPVLGIRGKARLAPPIKNQIDKPQDGFGGAEREFQLKIEKPRPLCI